MLAIVNYGLGNVGSISFKLKKAGVESLVTSDPAVLKAADKIILPGVGHFKKGMENLESMGLLPVLHEKVLAEETPILGICLGMQLFTSHSEEGNVRGLNWIAGQTRKFDFAKAGSPLRVPHIGWESIRIRGNVPALEGVTPNQQFYFTHSFYVKCDSRDDVLAEADYGMAFDSVIGRKNILGTQFHPEKSHREGFEIVLRFARGYL